jgi:hypothetical protein
MVTPGAAMYLRSLPEYENCLGTASTTPGKETPTVAKTAVSA